MARDRRKSVRLTREEEKHILEKAASEGKDFSSYVRNAVFHHKTVMVPGIKDLYLQVARIGNNLNQLTMLSHQGKIVSPNLSETREMLNKVYDKLHEISEEISNGNIQKCNGQIRKTN